MKKTLTITLATILLILTSCQKEMNKNWDGTPMLQFVVNVGGAAPVAYIGTEETIQTATYSVSRTQGSRAVEVTVSLLPTHSVSSKTAINKDIPFDIVMMDENSVTSGDPATSTILTSAVTFPSSGVIPAGQSSTTFEVTAQWSGLSISTSLNRLYLQILSTDPDIKVSENFSRKRFVFQR